MKPNRLNQHGSKARRINPLTGRRYDYETRELERNAEQNAHDEQVRHTENMMRAAKLKLTALRGRDDLLEFTRFTMPDPRDPNDADKSVYEPARVHEVVARDLAKFIRGEMTNDDGSPCTQLIFCMPPRHGKTQLSTKSLTAWASGRHPEWDIAVASYSDTMAQDMGADTRAILQSKRFGQVFPTYDLRKGGAAKDNIQTDKGGRLVFVGRGGALTGRGMCLGIGDDLFKDHEEARSQAIRDQAWNWFTKVFMTRRMGPKLVILTMTRWHSDDIIGRITDPENDCYNAIEAKRWKIIRLPAIAEDDDPLQRETGEALWPERFGLDFLQSQQRIDPLGFAALYQQTPTVADGTLFRRETIQDRRYEPGDLPEGLRYYATSDHAVGTKQRNDPSCFLKGGVDPQGNLWLTDIFWQRVPSDKAVEMMLEMGHGTDVDTRPLLWWAERGHISKSIGPFLKKRMLETSRFLNVQEITPVGDKEQRAQSIAARVSLGKVYFPKGMIWDKAIEEMMAFPNGLRDDFVDALSLFGLGLTSQFGRTQKTQQRKEPRFGSWAWIKADQQRADAAKYSRVNGGF